MRINDYGRDERGILGISPLAGLNKLDFGKNIITHPKFLNFQIGPPLVPALIPEAMATAMAATVAPPALILWIILVLSPMFLSISSASEFSLVVSGPMELELSPSLIVENSPGSKPGRKVKCERVQIHGLPRIEHLNKFANSLKVKVSCVNPSSCPPNIGICFHRNASLVIGMCPKDQWERLTEGLWVKSMSPFDHKILDIRMAASYSESLHVSLDEGLLSLIDNIPGMGNSIDESGLLAEPVYSFLLQWCYGYRGFLVILMILFQGMKLLPTGRKSSFAIFLYSCSVGLGSFLLRYVPRLLRSLLVEIGLSEDMYNPLAVFLLVFLVIAGAWLGFWVVRKLVLTEDGSIDIGVSHFITWSIRMVASVILQSSVDPLLAVEALVGAIIVSSVLRKFVNPKVVRRVYKKLCRLDREPLDPMHRQSPTRPFPDLSPELHILPYKDEWESFTKESTLKELEDLVSTPDFSKWAVAHADRQIRDIYMRGIRVSHLESTPHKWSGTHPAGSYLMDDTDYRYIHSHPPLHTHQHLHPFLYLTSSSSSSLFCIATKSRTMISQPPLTQHTKIRWSDHNLMGRAKPISPVIRCCIAFNDHDRRARGSCALGGGTLVEAMREERPYIMAHRGSTLVVVLSSEIVGGPHLPSILE
ncbi:hypothetical protein Sango_1819000 [Sesamum angolense]|uniref:Uncharacterized protein n=1 Tax=Sesamum angolense TaxID=2727404 RepID=A0AAE2BPY4_9LAMI|nr:hypothetical protein Sango_1819000 [Sesamum angolense]